MVQLVILEDLHYRTEGIAYNTVWKLHGVDIRDTLYEAIIRRRQHNYFSINNEI
jgi:hypothetical protein